MQEIFPKKTKLNDHKYHLKKNMLEKYALKRLIHLNVRLRIPVLKPLHYCSIDVLDFIIKPVEIRNSNEIPIFLFVFL